MNELRVRVCVCVCRFNSHTSRSIHKVAILVQIVPLWTSQPDNQNQFIHMMNSHTSFQFIRSIHKGAILVQISPLWISQPNHQKSVFSQDEFAHIISFHKDQFTHTCTHTHTHTSIIIGRSCVNSQTSIQFTRCNHTCKFISQIQHTHTSIIGGSSRINSHN